LTLWTGFRWDFVSFEAGGKIDEKATYHPDSYISDSVISQLILEQRYFIEE